MREVQARPLLPLSNLNYFNLQTINTSKLTNGAWRKSHGPKLAKVLAVHFSNLEAFKLATRGAIDDVLKKAIMEECEIKNPLDWLHYRNFFREILGLGSMSPQWSSLLISLLQLRHYRREIQASELTHARASNPFIFLGPIFRSATWLWFQMRHWNHSIEHCIIPTSRLLELEKGTVQNCSISPVVSKWPCLKTTLP